MLGDRTVVFDTVQSSPMQRLVKDLMEIRNLVRSSNPMYREALKVMGNSLYGSLGYYVSPLYGPSYAASVTAIGRYCAKYTASTFRKRSMVVAYGDIDSCMVRTAREDSQVKIVAQEALDSMHSIFMGCALRMMFMEVQGFYPPAATLDKKRYCLVREDGAIKTVGVSAARKDTLSIYLRLLDADEPKKPNDNNNNDDTDDPPSSSSSSPRGLKPICYECDAYTHLDLSSGNQFKLRAPSNSSFTSRGRI
ncbi:hypothetical protein AYL99_11749 [Fonsecaea erecta]|uniref:DNA-directed DNA polymerase n=1 Tax=Fonsecaea erecta TaxID=1367422 RepID=A0A178Z3C3_9EURO|nr:hypothetical protein AYL99_11749 [Fonsecaea erecta]OAP54214.1 hypothetical protein AYL99_11749 [Fonsecaea erecta]